MDTSCRRVCGQSRLEIDLESIDYIITNHGEVDHSGALPALMARIPNTPIYCTANAVKSLVGQFHHPEWNFKVVKTGDTLDIGNGKQLVFVEMPMLHWPDSMATYMTGDNILFSNDAFGQHFAVEELFNDKADPCLLWAEAMKYYANILNPFSPLVKKKIDEILALNLTIDIIAPSHGAIWREDPLQIVHKYYEWSQAYQTDQITIAYDTMWEGTTKIAHRIADEIARLSPDTRVKVFNIARGDKNDIMTEVFRSKAIAVGSPTVGATASSPRWRAGWSSYTSSSSKIKGRRLWLLRLERREHQGAARASDRCRFRGVEPEIKCKLESRCRHLGRGYPHRRGAAAAPICLLQGGQLMLLKTRTPQHQRNA